MSKFKQVFPAGGGTFTFRVTLPGGLKFQAEESWPSPDEAAFAVDALKFYVSKKYSLKSSSLLPSLPLASFFSMLREAGADPTNLEDLFTSLSFSTREMLQISGHELLAEHAKNERAAKQGWSSPSQA